MQGILATKLEEPRYNVAMSLAFILSQPRSGSTVLTAMLDKRKGVVCMPESSFPQVLGMISEKERSNPRWLAALYRASTFPPRPAPPTPLMIRDAEKCMGGTNEEILFSLGKALATKLGRDESAVQTVVWKTTRTIGLHVGPMSTSGKFIILRRNPYNVFESQFRVEFGLRNRNPFRYAIFSQSYECAFKTVPAARKIELEYDEIPERFIELLAFLQIDSNSEWEQQVSSINIASQTVPWLSEVTGNFRNNDASKRDRLSNGQKSYLSFCLFSTKFLRPLTLPLRRHYDLKTFEQIRAGAHYQLAAEGLTSPL